MLDCKTIIKQMLADMHVMEEAKYVYEGKLYSIKVQLLKNKA